MPDTSTINPETIENLRSLSPDDGDAFLREIIDLFLHDTPQRLTELADSQATNNIHIFARAAHSIKGSASNLGALLLSDAASSLEQHARTSGFDGIAPLLEEVRKHYTKAAQALRGLISAT